jgi:1-acyl-sn-glycerol-3-phosphate acyltransferase
MPRRVQVAFSEAIPVSDLAATPDAASTLIADTLWPEVEGEYRRLRARPTLIAAGLAALGIGGGLVALRRRKPPPRRGFDRLRRR